MPRELKRFQESKQSHFVTFSCYRRRPLLCSGPRCDLFVDKLEQTRERFSFRIYGYVVMPEHVHVLVTEPDRGRLSDAIHSLKLAVAKGVAAVEQKPGRLWQARYYDRNVRDYDEFVEKLRYIHRNPVKRGLVKRPENWVWSSFRHYATGEHCGVEIESEWTTRRRERDSSLPR